METDDRKRARRHHILPQSYLCRFAREGMVNVVDFDLAKTYRTNVSNAACIDDFYTVETTEKAEDDCVEQSFLAKLEGLPGPIIDAIVKDVSVPQGHDWVILANYLALMYVRGPWFRQIVLDAFRNLAKGMAEWLHSDKEIYSQAMSEFARETGHKVTMDFDEAVMVYKNCDISAQIPRNFWVKQMMLMASDLVSVFHEMTPSLLYIPAWSYADFVTGDTPIVPVPRRQNPPPDWKWLRNPEADLFFPLSSRRCLVLNYDAEPRVLRASRKRAAFVNHLMALNCTRVVLSEKPHFIWLRKRGTVSGSPDELIRFVQSIPEAGPVTGEGWDVLRGER